MSLPSVFACLSSTELEKLAEEDVKPKLRALKPELVAALGTGSGMLFGAGAAHLANKAYKHMSGQEIPHGYLAAAVPTVVGGLGLAYALAEAKKLREIENALASPHDQLGR
jgi:TRAP-type C4-dicarboxylate transport system permease small subunit